MCGVRDRISVRFVIGAASRVDDGSFRIGRHNWVSNLPNNRSPFQSRHPRGQGCFSLKIRAMEFWQFFWATQWVRDWS
jgi:hypothetical protein